MTKGAWRGARDHKVRILPPKGAQSQKGQEVGSAEGSSSLGSYRLAGGTRARAKLKYKGG